LFNSISLVKLNTVYYISREQVVVWRKVSNENGKFS